MQHSSPNDPSRQAAHLPVQQALSEMVARWMPGAELTEVQLLGVDDAEDDDSLKATGYGQPLLVSVRKPDEGVARFVVRTASANEFGHDRRADRAAAMILAYDSFNQIPSHVQAVHLGGIGRDGRLVHLNDIGELFVITAYADGDTYAEELRQVARRGRCSERDRSHARQLGRYLAALHTPLTRRHAYARALRDLVGDGEGILGIVDAYPPDVPGASPARLQAIEVACMEARWRWRGQTERLVRSHGDFHPFNLLFTEDSVFTALDASRGCAGDAADDVVALSINYLFFGLQHRAAWADGFRPLWRDFWETYQQHRRDDQLLNVAPIFFAWRALVLSSPRWYPQVDAGVRERLLGAAEASLASGTLSLEKLEEIVR